LYIWNDFWSKTQIVVWFTPVFKKVKKEKEKRKK
jgi:hypothetical protein